VKVLWTEAEDDLLRQHYPGGGLEAVLPLLPDRSRSAIAQRVNRLGVYREFTRARPGRPCGPVILGAEQRALDRLWRGFCFPGAR